MQPSEKGGENNPEAFSLSKHSGQALGRQTPQAAGQRREPLCKKRSAPCKQDAPRRRLFSTHDCEGFP